MTTTFVVDKSTLPDGYEITSQNQGDDDITIVISNPWNGWVKKWIPGLPIFRME